MTDSLGGGRKGGKRKRRPPFTCVICGLPSLGWPCNPWPVTEVGYCCERCDRERVLPARVAMDKDKE